MIGGLIENLSFENLLSHNLDFDTCVLVSYEEVCMARSPCRTLTLYRDIVPLRGISKGTGSYGTTILVTKSQKHRQSSQDV